MAARLCGVDGKGGRACYSDGMSDAKRRKPIGKGARYIQDHAADKPLRVHGDETWTTVSAEDEERLRAYFRGFGPRDNEGWSKTPKP